MNKNMKMPPSQWVAHDCTKAELLPKTLRGSLVEAKAAFLWQNIMPYYVVDQLTISLIQTGCKPSSKEIIDLYGDQIPDNIKFIIVTLQPRWETEI